MMASFSGKHEDIFVTDKYYYYEGEKFFVFFDKDLKIPGDLCDNIALVMDQLEEETGLSFDYPEKVPSMSLVRDSFFGADDPWRYIEGGKKFSSISSQIGKAQDIFRFRAFPGGISRL